MTARAVVAVAYSGGRDSTALLRATLEAAAPLEVDVVALHVHHGLSPKADEWLAHCEATCRRWARAGRPIAFEARRLDERPARGDSVEAWARRGRYRALGEMARRRGIELVLLAHHRRDQAETFLLQALRGSGVEGLSAMPAQAVRDGVTWARPWLTVPREMIDDYVRRHRLTFVDDESNADVRFARNRLRASVWPALVQAFPDAEASLVAAARRAQHGAAGLAEWAIADLASTRDGDALDIARWRELSPARRSSALRAWLRERDGRAAPASLVERLMDELDRVGSGRWPSPQGELRLHRGLLRHDATVRDASKRTTPTSSIAIDLSRVGSHRVDEWHGTLVVRRATTDGIAASLARVLELRPRRPGDRFQAGVGRPARSLKLQFQSAGVPAWKRSGPIVASAATLVHVPGLGLDARAVAMPGEPRVTIDWLADAPRPDEVETANERR